MKKGLSVLLFLLISATLIFAQATTEQKAAAEEDYFALSRLAIDGRTVGLDSEGNNQRVSNKASQHNSGN